MGEPYLKELRDIHLPSKVSVWPLPWGYWVLMGLLLLAFICYRSLKPYLHAFRTKQAFLAKLKALETKPNEDTLSQLALLLKQAALINYPRMDVAGLYGDQWLLFLSKTAKNMMIQDLSSYFSQALYQPAQVLDLKPALFFAKSWLKQQRFRSCMN